MQNKQKKNENTLQNKILIILGMHRSGTSFFANWLHSCGLNIGDLLLNGDFSNKDGHFEDLDFLNLHKKILIHNELKPNGLSGLTSKNLKLDKYL